jgi:hypothetical protein
MELAVSTDWQARTATVERPPCGATQSINGRCLCPLDERTTFISHFPLLRLEADYISPGIHTVLDVHCFFAFMIRLLSLFALAFVELVHAAAVRVKRQDITTLSSTQIAGFAPFTHLASAAYCNPSLTKNWDCGGAFTRCSL